MKIVRKLVNWLISKGTVSEEDRELYEYAGYSLFISILPVIIIIIIGSIMGHLIESILIIIPFMCLRKFCGGFHLKYAWLCLIISCGILFASVYIISYIKFNIPFNLILIFSIISLIILSPIDSKNRRLENYEMKKYKIVTMCMLIFFTVIYVILISIRMGKNALCIAEGVILTAMLQIPCLFEKTVRGERE